MRVGVWRRRTKVGEGARCEKLRDMLEGLGMRVDFIRCARGGELTDSNDIPRWEAFGASSGTGSFTAAPAGFKINVRGRMTVGEAIKRCPGIAIECLNWHGANWPPSAPGFGWQCGQYEAVGIPGVPV